MSDVKGAPDLLVTLGRPDAAPAYTWRHISWDKDAGLNYLQCSDPAVGTLLAGGLVSGEAKAFSDAGTKAIATGCWLNLIDVNDFVVAQPWLKGIKEAHVITEPTSLRLTLLTAG